MNSVAMAKPAPKNSHASQEALENVAPLGRGTGDVAAIRQDDFDRNVWCLLGIPVDIADIDQATAEIDRAVRSREKLSFVTPNVNWLVRAMRDKQARREILEADLSLVDGAPLVALAKLLGVPVLSRVAGSDLFETLRRRPGFTRQKVKVYFFGGRDGAAEAAAKALNQENGAVEAVGWHNPGFGEVESMSAQPIIDKINEADPDFIVVALGAAKGQAWIDRNQRYLTAPVMAHLGAVVDFTAGGIARAPKAVQSLGLEWAWRIKEEPSLWRRYFLDGLSLAKVALTRLLPQVLSAKSKAGSEAGRVWIEQDPARATVHFAGNFSSHDLQPVRQAFRNAAGLEKDVCLDFSRLQGFDRAFLGQVLMLEKHVVRNGCLMYLEGAKPAQLKVLHANEISYAQPAVLKPSNLAQPAPQQAVIRG